MTSRVRVRGVAATAITKILLDHGYRIVQASDIIRRRFNILLDTDPADVTVKDSDRDELLVLGFYGHADKVYDLIVDELKYVFKWVSPIGLHSVHVGIVTDRKNNTCVVELRDNLKGYLPDCELERGKKVVVGVSKAPIKPGEKIILTRNFRIVGEYAALIYGKPILSISEHVRDRERREYLLAIAMSKTMGSGYGVHLRSSSMYASRENLESEIDLLMKKMSELLSRAREANKPAELYEGEFIGLIGLTSEAKKRLDTIRDRVIPTVRGHHSLKYVNDSLSDLVDYAEILLSLNARRDLVERALNKYIMDKNKPETLIKIIHYKPSGKYLQLTPGTIHSISEENDRFILVVKRIFRSEGVYDGLGIEKKPGDTDYMILSSDSWIISHNYFRDNKWLGTYININTPPEILPRLIKYHDLLIDVVIYNDYKVEIIDLKDFEKYCSEGIISEELCLRAKSIAEEVVSNPEKYVYRKKDGAGGGI